MSLCMLWLYKVSNVYSTVEELVVIVKFSLSIVSNSYYVAIEARVVS